MSTAFRHWHARSRLRAALRARPLLAPVHPHAEADVAHANEISFSEVNCGKRTPRCVRAGSGASRGTGAPGRRRRLLLPLKGRARLRRLLLLLGRRTCRRPRQGRRRWRGRRRPWSPRRRLPATNRPATAESLHGLLRSRSWATRRTARRRRCCCWSTAAWVAGYYCRSRGQYPALGRCAGRLAWERIGGRLVLGVRTQGRQWPRRPCGFHAAARRARDLFLVVEAGPRGCAARSIRSGRL